MPDRARLEAFVATVVGGEHVRAIADFYHEDASMQENLTEPRRGRELLMAHEQAALDRVAAMHTHPPTTVLLDGDDVVIAWTFDMTSKSGQVRRLQELALQRWRGDRIAEERFVYDSATAWTVVEG
ncbi:MAG TPA: nuclear transport factor 2 family protein [Phenylobacterium sp.]